MGDWKVWLVAFLGLAAVLAVGVASIAVNILRAQAARRRGIKRFRAADARRRDNSCAAWAEAFIFGVAREVVLAT
jgi:hypothetical protein